jgi:membrane protease YdiL (CAAX protease family)
MVAQRKSWWKLSTFLGLTFLLSTFFYINISASETSKDLGGFMMWAPGLAALITQLIFKDPLSDLGWKIGKLRYLFLGYAIAFLYSLGIYTVVWLTGLGEFQTLPFANLIIYLTVGLAVACFTALGEEIGWRGLLVPELLKLSSARTAALVSGLIWALWHFPVIIQSDYQSAAPLWVQLTAFSVSVLGMAVLTTWLRIESGSIWPAVIWHGAHNLFVQQIFLSMTLDTGLTEYFVDDFGMGLSIAFLIIGLIFWRKIGSK